MSLQTRKLSLIEWLASLNDENLIAMLEALRKKKKSAGEIKPMSPKEYQKVIEESEDDIKKGRVYAHEDVVKYMKSRK